MRVVLCVAAVCVCACVSASAGFLDTFTYPDGTMPPEYTWTGDPRGGGQFAVMDGQFVHTTYGHIHFFRPGEICGEGIYEFDAKDTDWGFAWRIRPDDPMAGPCFCFYHNNYWGWGYNFVEFGWWTLDPGQYPQGQYMWHNGWHTRHEFYPAGAPSGWVHVRILDLTDHVKIWVNEQLIFDLTVVPIPAGYVGLGSSWAAALTPAFDNVRFDPTGVPVTRASWGAIKALFD
jgi:hypothetical protein